MTWVKHFYTSAWGALTLFLTHLLPAVGCLLLWAAAHSPYVQGFTLLSAALYQGLRLLLLLARLRSRRRGA